MMDDAYLPYARQSIDEEDIDAVNQALKKNLITRGPEVEAFENEVCAYCGVSYAVSFNSGSTALSAAFYAAAITRGDRILTSPNTFVSSVGTGMQLGGDPVFIDIEPLTGCVDLEDLAVNINTPASRSRPFAVPVHFGGLPVDMERLDSLIQNPDAIIIEDAAHALGSSYPRQGPKVGSCAWSQMTVFSFHPAKNITTGEGGMVTTNNPELCHRLRFFRNNGIERDPARMLGEPAPWVYEVQDVTNNYNFTEFQAALGRSQLRRLDRFVEKRRALIQAYREKLKHFSHVKMLTDAFDSHTAFHLCVVLLDFQALGITRAQTMVQLREAGIGTQVHYIPLYHHPYFRKTCGEIAQYFPKMEHFYSQALSLPLFYDMAIEDVDRVIEVLGKSLGISKN